MFSFNFANISVERTYIILRILDSPSGGPTQSNRRSIRTFDEEDDIDDICDKVTRNDKEILGEIWETGWKPKKKKKNEVKKNFFFNSILS